MAVFIFHTTEKKGRYAKSVQEHLRLGRRFGTEGLPELLRSTPAGKSTSNVIPRTGTSMPAANPVKSNGEPKETGRANEGIV
jgi:hypothetical protein